MDTESIEVAVAVASTLLLLLSEGLAICKQTKCNSITEFIIALRQRDTTNTTNNETEMQTHPHV